MKPADDADETHQPARAYHARVSVRELDETPVCPFLGISGDPSSHFSFPEASHRCHAQSREQGIDLAYQSSVCMSGAYHRCSRYERAVVPAKATTRASPAPRESRARSWRRVLGRVAMIALLAVLLVALIAVGRALIDGPLGGLAGPQDAAGPPMRIGEDRRTHFAFADPAHAGTNRATHLRADRLVPTGR